MRLLFNVEDTCPPDPALISVPGSANTGWFVTLKNSARNCRRFASRHRPHADPRAARAVLPAGARCENREAALGVSDDGADHHVGGHGIHGGRTGFSADDDGDLVAFDAGSGKALWHFYTGATMHASPMTFSVDGKQYVTIAAGTNLFTFGLM
jgi:outer membrane protein assembly factor BamB